MSDTTDDMEALAGLYESSLPKERSKLAKKCDRLLALLLEIRSHMMKRARMNNADRALLSRIDAALGAKP